MSKKKKTPEQSRTERKHLKMVYAKSIKELYPNVENIFISYSTSLNGTGGWGKKPGGSHTYSPDSKTLFEYDCPHIHCMGSFDLADEISDMIHAHKSTTHPKQKICQHIVRDHPCWVEFDYVIKIDYI
ncbi:MAG TPA: hypothetical protein ENH40_04820 [Nitrospirae bacterium]|nr:hypothetical protein [Nitrospirota bacterium]